MGSYGFKPQELNISDHRILLVLRDAMQLRNRIDRLSKIQPKPKGSRTRKPKSVDTGPVPEREQLGTHPADHADAMARILLGG